MQPPDVNKNEQKRIEAKGFKDFLARPDETGISWIRRMKDDSCFFLTKENNCAIYDVRPAVCRLEPFTIMDFDYENNKIVLELNFPFTACCPGLCEEGKIDTIKEIAEAAQVLVQKILALTAKDMELSITDKKVYAETRSRLLRRTVEMADLHL